MKHSIEMIESAKKHVDEAKKLKKKESEKNQGEELERKIEEIQ